MSRIDSSLLNPGSWRPAENKSEEAQARQVAAHFESLLLNQLTSALNRPAEEEGDELFGSGATDMYRQMLSEHLSESIAKSGGIGLAEVILKQLHGAQPTPAGTAAKAEEGAPSGLQKALSAARSLRREAAELTPPAPPPPLQAGARHGHAKSAELVKPASAAPAALQMPVAGRISSGFGSRRDPIHGAQRNHKGLDIAAPRGTPIEAAASGTVIFAGRQRGYGKTVVVELPDGRRTRYAHADRLAVRQGEVVAAGQVIATVGSTGRATGPHLHFEVTENGRALDPLKVLAKDTTLARR